MMDTWYWRDVVALLDDAEEQDKQRFRDSENLAMLVDREDFSLNGEYVDRITDPNDPEVKADIARRKAAGPLASEIRKSLKLAVPTTPRCSRNSARRIPTPHIDAPACEQVWTTSKPGKDQGPQLHRDFESREV